MRRSYLQDDAHHKAQMREASDGLATLFGMWLMTVVCSSCAEESEVVVEDLDDVDREVCECGYSYVVLSVAEFEPVRVGGGELVELRRRGDDMPMAA